MTKRKFHIRVEVELIQTDHGWEPVNSTWAFGKYDSEAGDETILAAVKTAALNEITLIKASDLWPSIELS